MAVPLAFQTAKDDIECAENDVWVRAKLGQCGSTYRARWQSKATHKVGLRSLELAGFKTPVDRVCNEYYFETDLL